MESFKGVEVVKKANVYFDGKVTSRTVLFPDGSKKTLGVMMPGEYTFKTAGKEVIEVLSGRVKVKCCHLDWQEFGPGQSFEIPENTEFHLKVEELLDYVCSYF